MSLLFLGVMKHNQYALNLSKSLWFCCRQNGLQLRWMSSDAEITNEHKLGRTYTAQVLKTAREKGISVESYSLSRGLALNRFEKDFLVYPEYTDPDALVNIKAFVSVFQKDFESSMSDANRENFYEKYQSLLERHQLFAAFIAKDFGGLGMSKKDLLTVYEVLGLNWSVFESIHQLHVASTLLTLFGSEDQKQKLLPKLASGELRPAICIAEDNLKYDFADMKTTIILGGEKVLRINGSKTQVIGPSNANFFFIFGNEIAPKDAITDEKKFVCYMVERNAATKDSIIVSSNINTLGLNVLEVSKVDFRDLVVTADDRLGSPAEGMDIAGEVIASKNITYAAAVIGFMRSLIGKLTHVCNTTVHHNLSLAEDRGIERLMTEMTLNTFVLESMAYYIGGMLDENLIITVDIENAIVHNFANRVLREAVATTVEILGNNSCDCQFEYEKMIRDVITVISLGNPRMNLADLIAMNTLTSWAQVNALDLQKIRSGAAGFFGILFGKGSEWHLKKNPKLQHFIAEHAHPSLQKACENLEYTMSHLNAVIGAILRTYGKKIIYDFAALHSVARVVEANLAMAATIARASRSYSVGLRNSDIEVAWTTTYCEFAAHKALTELQVLDRFFGLIQMNPSLLQVGRTVFDSKGYCVESPIELNW